MRTSFQHSADGILQQLLVRDVFDVIGFDLAEHLGEGPELVERQGR
jgi:hypothetical protein